MKEFTIRVQDSTLEEIDEAAYNAGLKRGVFIRTYLEQTFDGTPRNPLGVYAAPEFYEKICEAFATMLVVGMDLDTASQKLVERYTRNLLENLEIG